MGWEQRGSQRYYYTAERIGGRVVKRYAGTGTGGEFAAQLEAATRAQRAAASERQRRERDELDALDEVLAPLNDLADALTAAALVAAGFYRHHRGEWRKRRV